jgi:DNA helicase II / ATP-dependent DNA helicase PcrA
MPYVADLHVHSRFARACSANLNIPSLAKWAKFKGIDLVGTGDCLHPLWQAELKRDLKDFYQGVYVYDGVKFLVTTEVACVSS